MIRRARPGDATDLYNLYFESVRQGAASRYSETQRAAWAPTDQMPPNWPDRLKANVTWVHEDGHTLTGFLSLRPPDYIDLFFVHPDRKGTGVAAALYDTLLNHATQTAFPALTTHASLLLRPFLERRNWRVVSGETVLRNGVSLDRFEMQLDLFD